MATKTIAKSEDEHIVRYVRTLASDASNVKQEALVKRAQTYFKLIKVHGSKLNPVSDRHEMKCVAACMLAGKELNHTFPGKQAVKLTGVSKTVFDRYVAYAGELLQVDTSVSVKEIAILQGVETCIPLAIKLLTAFKSTFGHNFEGVREDQNVAAAVFLAATKMHLKVNKKELTTLSKLNSGAFNLLVDQMRPLYPEVVDSLTQSNKKTGEKESSRKRKRVESDDDESDEDLDAEKHSNANDEDNETEMDWPSLKMKLLREAFLEVQKSDPAKFKSLMAKYKSKLPQGFSLR
ncbi:uncharacterized protein LOC129585978 [Paramacrobiotus metropolitanus]|uniref:uncharacterized protein LOC129585978 n=1 Tax=Paramacrobiotus metropolitanus TaxID=2943436 RepID=UPI0024461739|nr:uncharacterized protein LOC129585978 [Paramacrobiotus metropolitanus]XP_055334917.1 uncharacterized protein LOC129585978 [Paramacrobiotus metropolitanus]